MNIEPLTNMPSLQIVPGCFYVLKENIIELSIESPARKAKQITTIFGERVYIIGSFL